MGTHRLCFIVYSAAFIIVLSMAVVSQDSYSASLYPGPEIALPYPSSSQVVASTTGDFNGDGILDIATANTNRSVSVLLGKGSKRFGSPVNYIVGGSTSTLDIVSGDLNGDGSIDLVTANNSSSVSVLLGNGDGSFSAATNFSVFPLGSGMDSVALGDMDGDGILDIVSANAGSNNISILLGNGNGTFQAATFYSYSGNPRSIKTGDFDGDGSTDIVTANYIDSDISVYLGNGDGTVQPAVRYVAGTRAISVTVSDFDGDGILDLATGNFSNPEVAIFIGNGDGTFQLTRYYSTSTIGQARSIASGDFDGDGNIDIALAIDLSSASYVAVLSGNGDGTFQPSKRYAGTGATPWAIIASDVDGDSVLDLISSNYNTNSVTFLYGNGDGTFQSAKEYSLLSAGPKSIVAGDLDGDSILDLVSANFDSSNISVLIGNGSGGFALPVRYATGTNPNELISGDFNGDGSLDLVTANSGSNDVSVFIGNGIGGFLSNINYPAGAGAQSVTQGDYNGDGYYDLATANASANEVGILLNNGDGTFQSVVGYPAAASPKSIVAADFNSDGFEDLATANSSTNNLSVLMGNGDGTFKAAITFLSGGSSPISVDAADFNGDSFIDLAVANSGSSDIGVLLGNGDGTFKPSANFSAGGVSFLTGPVSIEHADVNKDGGLDIVTASGGANSVSVLIGNGNGTFKAQSNYIAGTYQARAVTVGDFNSDGSLDLATTNYGTGVSGSSSIGILLNLMKELSTAITLTAFRADRYSDMTVVTWRTSSESDNWGFRVLRSESPTGPFTPVSHTLIPARGGPGLDMTYTYVDRDAEVGKRYYYRLEDVSSKGIVTTHSVVPLTVPGKATAPSLATAHTPSGKRAAGVRHKGSTPVTKARSASSIAEPARPATEALILPPVPVTTRDVASAVQLELQTAEPSGNPVASSSMAPTTTSASHAMRAAYDGADPVYTRQTSAAAPPTLSRDWRDVNGSDFSVSIEDAQGNLIEVKRLTADKASLEPLALEVVEHEGRTYILWQVQGLSAQGFKLLRSPEGQNHYETLINYVPNYGDGDSDVYEYTFSDRDRVGDKQYDYRLEVITWGIQTAAVH